MAVFPITIRSDSRLLPVASRLFEMPQASCLFDARSRSFSDSRTTSTFTNTAFLRSRTTLTALSGHELRQFPPRSRLFPTPRITITVFPTSTAPSPTPQPRRCSDHEHDYGTSHAHGFYPDTITLVSPDDHEPHSCFEIALPETRRIQ